MESQREERGKKAPFEEQSSGSNFCCLISLQLYLQGELIISAEYRAGELTGEPWLLYTDVENVRINYRRGIRIVLIEVPTLCGY